MTSNFRTFDKNKYDNSYKLLEESVMKIFSRSDFFSSKTKNVIYEFIKLSVDTNSINLIGEESDEHSYLSKAKRKKVKI